MLHKTRMMIAAAALCVGVAACSAEQREEMEADKLAQFELSESETEIAEAFIAGMKIETRRPLLRSQDYARIACYAKTVDMPRRMERAHMLYLKDYVAADKDYYGFFGGHGINDQLAYDMGTIYRTAWEDCSLGAMMKKRMGGT